VLAAWAVFFAAGYAWFAAQPSAARAAGRLRAHRVGHRPRETAESAAVASLASSQLRGSAFGLLATVQSAGNLIASSVAGLLWTALSPAAAFIFLASAMPVAAALALTTFRTPHPVHAGS
jgi:hypothetical protein